MGVVTAALPVRVPSVRFVALLLAAPAVLALARVLPDSGFGLALRLAAAAVCVLLLPGAVLLRAIGWPGSLGLALAGSVAWSLMAIFAALALTFLANGSLTLTIAVVVLIAAGALIPALRSEPQRWDRRDALAVAVLLVAGIAFAVAVWRAPLAVTSDWPFHLARIRKLAELPTLSSIHTVSEFASGGVHPGYAFPLWQGFVALVARLAGIDPAVALPHMSAVLTPLAVALPFAAGRELFRSWGGGVAVAVGQVAVIGLPTVNVSSFRLLALPLAAAPLLLVPVQLAFTFAFVREGKRRLLLTLAAASLALAVVHPTYALFTVVPIAGFLAARVLLVRSLGEPGRIAAILAALLVPSLLFFLWLLPFARDAVAQTPSSAQRATELRHYAGRLDFVAGSFHVSPEVIVALGASTVAGLLAVPFAAFAARRLWAAFVLGGTLAVLALLLLPGVFELLADAVSLTQALRLKYFLPLAFALAGTATFLARGRLAGVGAALGAGLALQLLYPDDGPGWAAWAALAGTLAAFAIATLRRPQVMAGSAAWTAAAAVAFVIPIFAGNVGKLHAGPSDTRALTPGLIEALREEVPVRAVVFADLPTSYRIAAYAPVYITAAPVGHVGHTRTNDPIGRQRDNARFFARSTPNAERCRILAKYGAGWLVVDKRSPGELGGLTTSLAPVYADERFALYRVRCS